MHLSHYVNNIERRHSVNLRRLYAYANRVLTDTITAIISIRTTLMLVLMSLLSPLTPKLLMFVYTYFYSLRHIYFNMEQTDDIYNIAETTVGKFRFYEVVLCENFLNIVSR